MTVRARSYTRALLLTALATFVLLAMATGSGRLPSRAESALLVGLHADADEAAVQAVLRDAGAQVTDRIDELNLLVVHPRPGAGERTVRRLQREPAVRYVERDLQLSLAQAAPSNDPLYLDGKQWNIDKLQVFKAWELLPRGQETIVGVIDTGVDPGHPDLVRRLVPNGCDAAFLSGCPADGGGGVPIDISGHGSHVAGIAGASANNGVGVTSVGGDFVRVLAVRVSPNASPLIDGSKALSAIRFAVANGARVLNLSFGGPCGSRQSDSQAWSDAVEFAVARDVLLVQAAGNDGGCAIGRYPGTDPRILSVAAVDREGFLAGFSSRGPWVSVAAPGVAIWSTVLNGGYASASGTSMAAPHVSALAALLFQVPGATREKVIGWIKSTCDGIVSDVQCGGTVNAYRAVHLAVKGFDPTKPPEMMPPVPPAPPAEMPPPPPPAE